MATITFDTITTLLWTILPTAIITGLGIGLGLMLVIWFAFKTAIREIKKEMPKWILELRRELTKVINVEKALRGRAENFTPRK